MVGQRDAKNSLPHRGALCHRSQQMDPQAQLAGAQALLGIMLLSFVPVVLLTLLTPLRNALDAAKRR